LPKPDGAEAIRVKAYTVQMKAGRNNHASILIDFDLGHDLETPLGNLDRHDHDRIFRYVDGDRQDNRVPHFSYTLLGE